MPELCRMGCLVIQMYHDDHPAPHIHVRYPGFPSIRVDIRTLEVKGGARFPEKQIGTALRWARLRRELLAAWERMEAGGSPGSIEPL